MGAMRKHNARMTPEVHTLIHHEPEYVSRTGIQLGFTSEQAPKSQHSFLVFSTTDSNGTNSPAFREHLLNAVLHYNSCHL